MKILILHDLIPLTQIRRQTINQAFFFLKYRSGVDPVLHAHGDPVDDALKTGDYDAIFLDASFLCWRWALPTELVDAFVKTYGWLKDHPAPKLAFPQDDYDRQAILDQWMVDWKIDAIFTPLPDFAEVLYPNASKSAAIQPFLTGFVDEVDLSIASRASLPIAERPIDIAYRARPLPANFGELGQMKTRIADLFAPACERAGLRHDISTDPSRTVFGDNWLDFLGSARYVLGTPSGSSVLDPSGEIAVAVGSYAAKHPKASFEEISRACVPPEASRYSMEAISPRIFETALTGACQILVRGEYGPLEPGRHYIAVERDFSNVDEVVAGLGDHDRAQRIADDCREVIRSTEGLHYRHAADAVENAIRDAWTRRGDAVRANRRLAASSGVASEQVERILRGALLDRQRLLRGLSDQFAGRFAIDPFVPGRYGDISHVLGYHWDRLGEHAAKGWANAGNIPLAIAQQPGFTAAEDVPLSTLWHLAKKRIRRRLRLGL